MKEDLIFGSACIVTLIVMVIGIVIGTVRSKGKKKQRRGDPWFDGGCGGCGGE